MVFETRPRVSAPGGRAFVVGRMPGLAGLAAAMRPALSQPRLRHGQPYRARRLVGAGTRPLLTAPVVVVQVSARPSSQVAGTQP